MNLRPPGYELRIVDDFGPVGDFLAHFSRNAYAVWPCVFRWIHIVQTSYGSRFGSGGDGLVKEASHRLRRKLPFCQLSLIVDTGDLFDKCLLCGGGCGPRDIELFAHGEKSSVPQPVFLTLMGEIPLGVFHVRPSLQAICAVGFLKPVYHDSAVFTTQEAAKLSQPLPLVSRCVASWRMGRATAPAQSFEGILAGFGEVGSRRKYSRRNPATSPRSADRIRRWWGSDFTHPWVGQAEHLACRKRQLNAFLRAEARTHVSLTGDKLHCKTCAAGNKIRPKPAQC